MNLPPQLPRGWASATIGELISAKGEFCDGDWVETVDQDPDGDVRLIQLADIGDGIYRDKSNRFMTSSKARELKCTYLQRGDVLIARMPDPLGRACIFPGDEKPAVTVVDVCIVRTTNEAVDHRWLQSFINSPRFRTSIASLQSGSTRKRISRTNLSTLKLPVPPANEQRRIVDKIEELFSDLDAGVAALRRVKANLKRYRAAVLNAAVTGKLTAEWRKQNPPAESADKLLARILDERRKKWEAEQIRKFAEAGKTPPKGWQGRYIEAAISEQHVAPPLPREWCWTSIGRCFDVAVGVTPSRAKPEYWNGDIPWVSSGEVQFCRIKNTRECITRDGLQNSHAQLSPPGSLLLGMIGEGRTRGQSAILDIAACNNQNCASIWVSVTPIITEYVYYWLCSQYEVTRRRGSGNNQPALNKARVQGIPLPLSPLDEQQQIVAEVDQRLSVVHAVEVEVEHGLKRAARLRQAILKRAFEGKLVPQDADNSQAVLAPAISQVKPGKSSGARTRTTGRSKVATSNVSVNSDEELFNAHS